MDQVKIGRFIAGCRKAKGLTQAKLAEQLDITDRAVSKWETGKSMPDASLMLPLCEILGISVNELLSGEHIEMENYNKIAEENLLELKRREEEHVRTLLMLEYVIGFSCSITFIVLMFVACCLVKQPIWQGVLITLAIADFAVGMHFGMKLEREAGYYECPHCGHRYVPDGLPFWLSMHMGRTRYLKCPQCSRRGWQKKVLSKE